LPPAQRQHLALQALAGTRPIAHLAHDHDVSRKFVYLQAAKAEQALDTAFTPPDPDAERVLFHLPVTKAWLQQLTLGLVLICHCSYRGVVELCRDLFDYALSVGTVHNRAELYDFVVAELGQRVPWCSQRLRSVWTLLKNQRNELLAFVVALESELVGLATAQQIPVAAAWAMLNTQARSAWEQTRWQRDAELHKQLGSKYHALSVAVADIRGRVVRASSVIENLNSRLRGYFFLRRELGSDYLALLQFFLNHRRFLRSERAERAERSPAELLTAQEHGHWLELLGFSRFVRQ
jgi:hypothetical protein